jgi:hypothetical protein
MYHNRNWKVKTADTVKSALAQLSVAQDTYFGIQLKNVIFLNDSTDDGFIEYAIIDACRNVQIDSWTVEWMMDEPGKLKMNIETVLKNYQLTDPIVTAYAFNRCQIGLTVVAINTKHQRNINRFVLNNAKHDAIVNKTDDNGGRHQTDTYERALTAWCELPKREQKNLSQYIDTAGY